MLWWRTLQTERGSTGMRQRGSCSESSLDEVRLRVGGQDGYRLSCQNHDSLQGTDLTPCIPEAAARERDGAEGTCPPCKELPALDAFGCWSMGPCHAEAKTHGTLRGSPIQPPKVLIKSKKSSLAIFWKTWELSLLQIPSQSSHYW